MWLQHLKCFYAHKVFFVKATSACVNHNPVARDSFALNAHVIMVDYYFFFLLFRNAFNAIRPGTDGFSCALKDFRYFMQNNTNIINVHNQPENYSF